MVGWAKYYTISYKGFEHPWILESSRVLEFPSDTKGVTVLYNYVKVGNRQNQICNRNNQNSGCLGEMGGAIGWGGTGVHTQGLGNAISTVPEQRERPTMSLSGITCYRNYVHHCYIHLQI